MTEQFRQTNRLRTEGLRILMEAAWEFSVARLVVQSCTGWPNSRTGNAIKTEVDPLDTYPLPAMQQTLDASEELETRAIGTAMPASVRSMLLAQLAQHLADAPIVMMMTTARGSSNAKARAVLGWETEWPSWRAGFSVTRWRIEGAYAAWRRIPIPALGSRRAALYLSVMIDWLSCLAVERDSERYSGAWLFRGTRVPVAALFENLKITRRCTRSSSGFRG